MPTQIQQDSLYNSRMLYVRVGYDSRILSFERDGTIGIGSARLERKWSLIGNYLIIEGDDGIIARLSTDGAGGWHGAWTKYEKMPVFMLPTNRKPVKKTESFLIVGSAGYVPDWWKQHGKYFIANHFGVVALNNAWSVTRERTDGWYIPCDFFKTGKVLPSHSEMASLLRCERMGITSYWVKSPYWYASPCNGTMALNAAYDILNRCDSAGVRPTIVFIGCDMIYKKDGLDHFYGNGAPDPLRRGEGWLNRALVDLKALGDSVGSIFTASTVETRLPFSRFSRHLDALT